MATLPDHRRTGTGTKPSAWRDGVTLIHEPWIKPFFRCNIWHVRGRDRDLLFDSGLGHVSLQPPRAAGQRAQARLRRQPHAFRPYRLPSRIPRPLRACAPRPHILADPRNEWTLADRYATDEMFVALPDGWDALELSRSPPAPAGRILEHGDVIDLGDRAFEVIHTPGHSPGGIALYEQQDRHPAVGRHRL